MKRNIEIFIDENELIDVVFSIKENIISIHAISSKNDLPLTIKDLTENQIDFIKNEINTILILEKELDKKEN